MSASNFDSNGMDPELGSQCQGANLEETQHDVQDLDDFDLAFLNDLTSPPQQSNTVANDPYKKISSHSSNFDGSQFDGQQMQLPEESDSDTVNGGIHPAQQPLEPQFNSQLSEDGIPGCNFSPQFVTALSSNTQPYSQPVAIDSVPQGGIPVDFDDGKIKILSEPREKFHPRTESEQKKQIHYIQPDGTTKDRYPTISISPLWQQPSWSNFIAVSLMAVDGDFHDYEITHPDCKNYADEPDANIWRYNEESHTIYYKITPDDFENKKKSFCIALIKSRQSSKITKKRIDDRQLYKSKLRFRRYCSDAEKNWYSDDNGTAYSREMIEHYSNVKVQHVLTPFGPLRGQEVWLAMSGKPKASDLSIELENHPDQNLAPIKVRFDRGHYIFRMPPLNRILTNSSHSARFLVKYHQNEIHHEEFSNFPIDDSVPEHGMVNETRSNKPTRALTTAGNKRVERKKTSNPAKRQRTE